jgi:aryl-alcohol dehydrogenase-like predicted oxidoreductase
MIMDAAPPEESTSPAIGSRAVGSTGVVVSPIGLDGAVFGWSTGIDQTAHVLDFYAATGGTLISTADHYAGGRSEVMIGAWLRTVADRSKIVLETRIGRHPDAAGLSKRSILRAVENSLDRLGTDYIDFLSFDGQDARVPLEESLETGVRLIAEGKVRFLSASNLGPDSIRRAAELAEESGGPAFRAIVVEYNLMQRTAYERDLQPLATAMGRGALTRLPLAHSYLTGNYKTRADVPDSIMFDAAARHVGRRGDRILDALGSVAKDIGETPGRIALAWVLIKPGVAAAILRVQNVAELEQSLGATRVRLERHHLALLDRVSAPS